MIKAGLNQGEVVWYNDRRGYGFVNIEGDEIFIHRSALEQFGLTFLYSGDVFGIEVAEGDDGPAIISIQSVRRDAPPALPSDTTPEDDEKRGVVKFFNAQKGYGFVEITDDEDNYDAFIHTRTLQACGLRTISEGQHLLLYVSDDGKGPQATQVRVIAKQ